MNTRTQGTIGKIFIQYTIALTLFAGLGIIDQVNAKPTEQSIEQLFDNKAVADTKRFLSSQGIQFSEKEMELAALVGSTTYELRDASQHLYMKNIRVDQQDMDKNWPLLSLNIQDRNMQFKLGSIYQH